jgi:cytochrome c oxidase subunit 2
VIGVALSRAVRLLKVASLVGMVAFLSAGCSVYEAFAFGWPKGVTPQAETMRALWIWATVAALVVGAIVAGLIMWSVALHRKRSDEMPRQTQYNLPLEIVYTVIPFVIVAVLFYFTVTAQNFVNAKVDNPDLRVRVVGFQWNWEFQYLQDKPGRDGIYQARLAEDGAPLSTVGSPSTIPILVVPTNRVVEYRIESTDVLHSFYVPEFLFKRDVFPRPEKNNTDNVFQTMSGCIRRSLRRAVRYLPRDDELRATGLAGRPVRPIHGPAGPDQPPDPTSLHRGRGARAVELWRVLRA